MLLTLFVILQTATQGQAVPLGDAARPTAATASVAGRITERDSGAPIPRALVTLVAAGRSQELETIVDEDGRYEFTGLAAGDFAIWAGPPELRATHLRQEFGRTEPMDRFAPPSVNLTLKPGEVRTGVDMALVRALAIEGRVLDPWGEPMAGVKLEVTSVGGVPVPAEVRSDDRGEFRLFGLAPGRYRVCGVPSNRFAAAPSDDGGRLVRTCHPGSLTESGAGEIVLASRDATGIDIRMQRSSAYSISGSIRDAGGNPAEGASILGYALDASDVSAHTVSRHGQFDLNGLLAGRYVIAASAGFLPGRDRRRAGPEPEMGYAEVDVDGHVSGLMILLSREQTLNGHVVFDGGPAPDPGALHLVVQTRPPRHLDRAAPSRPPFSPVDDNLRFTLNGVFRIPLAVGIYNLPEGWTLERVRHGDRDITDIAVDLGSPEEPDDLEIVLTNRIAQPAVHVVDERDQPVTAVRVLVLSPDPERWSAPLPFAAQQASADGAVTLGPLVPGEYLIAALPPGEALLVAKGHIALDRVARIATRVALAEGSEQVLHLRLVSLPPESR